ncbi:MAG: tRNA dihydrouridine synthase DusB [Clostridia bacterium]|nr:tRNA dihydrouridine synthase DusB [Clostridia bacterium]
MKIGNLKINNNIFLAPMAGISDMPFRILCKEKGAGLVYTEMISSKGMYYNDSKTKKIMEIAERERPVAVQIFGSNPEIMGQIAKEVSKEADIIDINMGCPAPKVTKNNEGSKLLLDLELIDKITKSVVENSSVPVTIKIRLGWDRNHLVATEVAKIAEKNGVSAITVHGRTKDEFFSGEIDYEEIRKVKESVSIPVIGNGNIVDGKTALYMFEKTGCDAIMIGRASNGNPWIFEQILEYLKTGKELQKPDKDQIKETMVRHLNMLCELKGERTAILEMRKQIAWYTKGFPNSSKIRNEINKIEDLRELLNKIEEI